jgi:glutamyl-tRNA(Gln) amidotransferase subunit D
MSYPLKILNLLKDAKIEIGDTIEVTTGDITYNGILMPHHKFSKDDIITIKMKSGYNIGIAVDKQIFLKFIKKGEKIRKKADIYSKDKSKPIIAILGTGGTIASYVDYRTGAVHPALSTNDLAQSVPELAQICNIRAKVLYSIFSEDMQVKHWIHLANEVARELNQGAKGVIIPHGTDTMGYTASALSFMLKNLTGPVILVGAQRSSDRPSTDSNLNLISASQLAINSDLGEVVVMMHNNISDSEISIHSGTRVRKMHTSKRDAFQSINDTPIGTIQDGIINLSRPHNIRCEGEVMVYDKMEEKVSIFYSHPGASSDHFEFLAKKNKGVVIAGTGLGHIPMDLLDSVKNAIESKTAVIMTSQCLYGRVNMNVYSSGRDLLLAGVISGEDMLPETALVKLMWVLGHTKNMEEVKNLMQSNLKGEMGLRRQI